MAKILTFTHKILIVLICSVLLIILMISSSHFIHRQYAELSDNLQNITHQLIRQTTYSLAPLVQSYSTENDNSTQILTALQHVIQQPWIIDISVYQLNGTLIARAGEEVPVRERLALEGNADLSNSTLQLVEKIVFVERPVGFIRLTLNPELLQLDKKQVSHITKLIWTMLALAGCLGFIMAYTLISVFRTQRKRSEISST